MTSKKRIGITIGDPAGIGPEIILKALAFHPEIYDVCTPIVIGPQEILRQTMHDLNLALHLNFVRFTEAEEMIASPGSINVFATELASEIPEYGKISARAGRMAFEAIKTAIDLAQKKYIQAVATAPINKQALKAADIPFTDHTAMFSQLTARSQTMTLFVTGKLRIFFYSRHIPLREVPAYLDRERLVQTMMQSLNYLKQLGIKNPHLAVAALNPHGGDNGLFGDEETTVIKPAVDDAQKKGLKVEGPIPADSVFHLNLEGQFDAVLSLYHDQGHIAAKTYDFYRTVSFTMGLPFLRTSVDHGTAFEIAGKNMANEISMVEAIKKAAQYAWQF